MKLLSRILGRRLKTSDAKLETIGPMQGVGILGLDALSSAAYGPEAALAILIAAGTTGLRAVWPILGCIVALLAVLSFSYWQTIAAYPGGGGSYTVAKENLGIHLGLIAASSLLVDYLLNVAVGISAGVAALESAMPAMHAFRVPACLGILAIITLINLRGVRESGAALSLPTYAFVATLLVTILLGIGKAVHAGGNATPVIAPPPVPAATSSIGLWLALRAFASGCTAMTGVEAVSNGVPIFNEPRARNAQRSLAIIVAVLALLLLGIGFLAHEYHVGAQDQRMAGYQSVISQIVGAVMGRGAFYYGTSASVLAVLALSANTSFAGFPRLCRLLADDGFLPTAFSNLGRRLVYSAGIIVLSVLAALLLIGFDGITDALIPLFAVGAFAAFTLSQAGMVVHWKRNRGNRFALSINGLGAIATAAALLIIIVAKFTEGAVADSFSCFEESIGTTNACAGKLPIPQVWILPNFSL